MAFCINCGQELPEGAKFCANCGEPVSVSKVGLNDERKTVYEGELHKCPNCGELLDSFRSHCPSCEYEIRNSKSSSSVKEFALKLETIESQKMQNVEQKNSLMKMLVGKDFRSEKDIEEARYRFEAQKQEEKANLIINFAVPNTKEDILEFMILASSNIDVKKGVDDEVSKAWISKLEQVYERAKMLMGNTPAFTQIKYIYDKKKAELKNRKWKGLAIASFIVGGYALLFGLISFSMGGFIGVIIGVCLIALGVKFISIFNKNKREYL